MCGEDAEAREAGKETESVEKGVAEGKGHRVTDGPHTHCDVRSEAAAEGVSLLSGRIKMCPQKFHRIVERY